MVSRQRKALGDLGERLAKAYLLERGYLIIASNYRCAAGEIDLIAQDDADLVFVEVRTRRGDAFGTPEESVTAKKQQRLIAAAETYLQDHDLDAAHWRIDVIGVHMTPRGKLLRVHHIPHAVVG